MASNAQLVTIRMPGGAIANYDVLYLGGINLIELINKAASSNGTTVPGGTNVSALVAQELFITKVAGSGYGIKDILRRVEVTNTSDGTSAVGWFNITKNVKLTVAPLGGDLRLEGEGLTIEDIKASTLTITQDSASPSGLAIGKIDDVISSPDGVGSLSLVGGTKRLIASLFELLKRTPVLGQTNSAGSSPVVLSSEQAALLQGTNDKLDVHKPILESIRDRLPSLLKGSGSATSLAVTVVNTTELASAAGGTGTSLPTGSVNQVDAFVVNVDQGVDYRVNDALRRITVYNTGVTPNTTSVYWFNVTQSKGVSAPDMTKVLQQVDTINAVDKVLGYRVIKVLDGNLTTVSAIESVVGGRVVGVVVYQETGGGQIIGDGGVGWDIPAGGAYTLSEGNGGSTLVLDGSIQLKSNTGIMRLGVTYRKSGVLSESYFKTDSYGGILS